MVVKRKHYPYPTCRLRVILLRAFCANVDNDMPTHTVDHSSTGTAKILLYLSSSRPDIIDNLVWSVANLLIILTE
jgi:hypothetical protein